MNIDDDFMDTDTAFMASKVLDSFAVSFKFTPWIAIMFWQQNYFQVSIRCWCAYNIPGMVLLTGGDSFVTGKIYHVFCQLANDPHEAVQKTIAGGFHEVSFWK